MAKKLSKMAIPNPNPQDIIVGAKLLADAIDRHTAVQERIAQVQEKQLDISIKKDEKIDEAIEKIKEYIEVLWGEITDSDSYKRYIKDILK